MRLACDAAELASVAQGVQASSMWSWIANSAIPGTEGAIYSVNSEAKLETAYALIRKAYELAEEEG
jgi:hypothetical protein